MSATRYRCTSSACPGGPWEGPPPADGLGRPTSHRDPATGRRHDLAPHERGTYTERPHCPVCGEAAVLVPEPEPLSGDLLGPAEPTDETLPTPEPPEDPVARLRRDWEAREAERDRREAERDARVQREIDALRPAPPAVEVPVPQGPQPVAVVHAKPANRRRVVGAVVAAVVLAAGIVAGAGLGPAWLPVAARVLGAVAPVLEQVVVEDTGAPVAPGPVAP